MKDFSILKSICGAVLLLTPLANANARLLEPDEALQRALLSSGAMRIHGERHLSLSYTESYEDNDYVFVFNNSDNGFIVVSADDRMPPLLGYSDHGTFDPDNASPALRWWLSQYAEETASLSSSTTYEVQATRSDSERKEIPVLLSTQWGQQNPYNLDCPSAGNKTCVTGCVATAMAQIIKFHNYPASGNGSVTYGDLSFDYENADFLYDLMLDSYTSSSSKESQEAVANLMFACGVSVNMKYSPEESGASNIYIAYALRNYFKYDNAIKYWKRDLFTPSQWEDLIYSELEQNRPVLYGGKAPRGGHQFICDGYDGNGLFHMNWGWNGHGDGYFRLDALDPHYQGVGGHEGGYNSDQTIICGIQPPVEGSEVWYPIYSDGSLNVTGVTGNRLELNFTPGGIWNYSQESIDVEILIEAVSTDGKEYVSDPFPFRMQGDTEPRTTYPFPGAVDGNMSGWTYPAPLNLPKDLPVGDYKCYVVIKTPQGNIQRVPFPITSAGYFDLTVNADGYINITPGVPEAKAEIKVTGFEPSSPVIQNEKNKFLITIENYGDVSFSGRIELRIFKDGERVNDTDYFITFNSIQPGDKPTFTYETSFDLEPGEYDFVFYDQYGEKISDPFAITVGSSGVSSVLDSSSAFDIYSSDGVLIMQGADKSAITLLPKGIYIIKASGQVYKIRK